jgi:hypothetical protein
VAKEAIMKLSQEALFFRSYDGSVIVYGDKWGETLFRSSDGRIFFELFRTGFGGSPAEHDLWFEDPHEKVKMRLHRKGNEIRLNGKVYKKIDGCSEIEVVPLPEVRHPEYLFGLPDEQYIYVSADKYHYSHDSFKLFLGDGEAMKEVSLKKVDWRHDNGTIIIETEKGKSSIPWKFDRELVPTWRKTKLAKLDSENFEIIEMDKKVQLRNKRV